MVLTEQKKNLERGDRCACVHCEMQRKWMQRRFCVHLFLSGLPAATRISSCSSDLSAAFMCTLCCLTHSLKSLSWCRTSIENVCNFLIFLLFWHCFLETCLKPSLLKLYIQLKVNACTCSFTCCLLLLLLVINSSFRTFFFSEPLHCWVVVCRTVVSWVCWHIFTWIC